MEKLNQWLTLIANFGVIAGLAFLAYEIRQNTSIAKASAYRDNVQDIAAWRELTITNPEVASLFGSYLRGDIGELDDGQRGRVTGLINNVMGVYENAYFARSYGIVGDEEWARFEYGACLHYGLATANGLSLRYITPSFRDFLDAACEGDQP